MESFSNGCEVCFPKWGVKEKVFVEQPLRFEVNDQEDNVYRLKKVLYGLKQAPRAWFSKINKHLSEKKFISSASKPTLYKREQSKEKIIIMCIYVDDLIITRNLEEQINYLKKEIKSMFEMIDLGSMKYFLSMEVIQCQMGIFLSQEKYAKELLKKFQTTFEKLVLTPMNINEKIEKDDNSERTSEKNF